MSETQGSTGKRWTDRLGRTIAPPVAPLSEFKR